MRTDAKYAIREDIDVAGTDGGLSVSSCAGTLNALSAMIEYRPTKRLHLHAGVLWSQVTGGLASGYFYHENLGPTFGLRFQF